MSKDDICEKVIKACYERQDPDEIFPKVLTLIPKENTSAETLMGLQIKFQNRYAQEKGKKKARFSFGVVITDRRSWKRYISYKKMRQLQQAESLESDPLTSAVAAL